MPAPASEHAPSFQPQPRIYGRPISPAEVNAPLPSRATPRLPGQPVYSDLLGPAAQQAGPPAREQPPGDPGAPPPRMPSPETGSPPAEPVGSPAERTVFYEAAAPPAALDKPPATAPASPAAPVLPQPGHDSVPAGPGEAAPDQPSPSRSSGLPVSLITGIVLVAAALVVLIALAVPLLLQQLGSDPEPPYAVGECVVQDGTSAVPAQCDEPGAFQVVLEVERIEDCPDYPAQHAITVSEPPAVFCVSPVEAPDVEG
jgi:hypothetical protein